MPTVAPAGTLNESSGNDFAIREQCRRHPQAEQRDEASLEPDLDGLVRDALLAQRPGGGSRRKIARQRIERRRAQRARDQAVLCDAAPPPRGHRGARLAARSPERPTRAARARRRNRVRCSFLCSPARLQAPAQARAAAKQVALDRAGRKTRDAGDLGDRHLVQVIQRQHGPLQGRQCLDLGMQQSAELGVGARSLEVEIVGDALEERPTRPRRRPARRSGSACARDGAARPSTRPARSRSSRRSRTGTDAGSGERAGTCPGTARACRRGVGPCD